MSKTKIEWADVVWNPISGCTPISEGCQNCYAKRMANRLRGRYDYPGDDPFKVTLHPEKLVEPLKWKKRRRVFVCSMGDLFHEKVEEWMIDEIFGVILACRILNNIPDHKFMILTKRPERMKQYFTEREPVELIKAWARAVNWIAINDPNVTFEDVVYSETCHDWDENGRNSNGSEYKPWGYINRLWPLPNVWLGVTTENQQRADERIPILLQIPAAVRFVSVEPMIGSVDIDGYLGFNGPRRMGDGLMYYWVAPKIDWVICGGETGPGARPMHPDWVRSLRDQCQKAGVPFFFKQWGEWSIGRRMQEIEAPGIIEQARDGIISLTTVEPPQALGKKTYACLDKEGRVYAMIRAGKKATGRLLDGRTWDEIPEQGVR